MSFQPFRTAIPFQTRSPARARRRNLLAPLFALVSVALAAQSALAAPPEDPKKAEHDAAAAAALATNDPAKIAGQTLVVCGGLSLGF